MYLKFIVFSVILSNVLCQRSLSHNIYSYQLPDGDVRNVKSLNVTINTESYQQFQVTIECYNPDSLKYFEVRLAESSKEFELRNGVLLDFVKCFNNATDNENYNYGLATWFNSLPYFSTSYHEGYPISIKFDEYATVNTDAFFENFDFNKFDRVTFSNLSFTSTKFFNNLFCESCVFENNGGINFNDFNSKTLGKTTTLSISFNKLINFNLDNLKKFKELNTFEVSDFELDDNNAFNVPSLFEHNVNITEIKIQKSKEKLTLHYQLFRGLKKVQRITLQDLQLDYIPKDMFKDLDVLYSVFLSSNNIKTVDPAIFETNKVLSFIGFENNPFFTEPHDRLETFDLRGDSIYLDLGNFTANSFDLLEQFIKNPKISRVAYQSFEIDKFNIPDFVFVNTSERNTSMNIEFRSGEPVLDLDYIKSLEDIIRSEYDVREQVNAVINIGFAGDAMCRDCTMIKRLFPHFLKRYTNQPGFYFKDRRLFVSFRMPDSCNHLEENFDKPFEDNCPTNCICKYNSLMERARIDCTNKKLTEIPHITYPSQFEKLNSLDLNFENNSISILSLDNQDADVLKKLSTLNFKNNGIETLQLNQTEAQLTNNVALNLCDNPIIDTIDSYIEIKLGSESKYVNRYGCMTEDEFQRVVNYIQDSKSNELDEHLNGLQCN